MGRLISTIFGGKQSKDVSKNLSYDYLTNALAPNISTGNQATGQIAALLGLGGNADAANAGFNNYLGSTGYNFMMDQGSRAITGNSAAKGLLQSGSTLKALTSFGQGLGQQSFNNYLTQLGSLVTGGQNSASVLANVGQYKKGTSSDNKGIIGGLTTLAGIGGGS